MSHHTPPRKTWDIHGGVHPAENKIQTLELPVAEQCADGEIDLPAHIILPLNQHLGAPAKAIVSVGDHVLCGQLIAQPNGLISAAVHASTSGTVVAIEDRAIAHPSGMNAPCIVIKTDGKDEWITLETCEDYTQLDREVLLEKIRNAGIAGMGGAGFPAAVKLNPRADQIITTLIINGTECEPYITADDLLMQTRADEVIAGTLLLAHLLHNPAEILIGIEDNKPKAIDAMRKAAAGTAVEVVSFPTKYPSGGEKQLIQILTGKEVPSGSLPAHIGVVCQNVGSTAAIWRAVRYGEPLTSRLTTLVGEALDIQRNVHVRLGTPIDFLLEQHGFDASRAARLIMGGPMMGFSLANAAVPVIKTSNCILAPSKAEMPPQPPAQACIRCGMCAEACPATLLPQQLLWYAQAEDFEKLEAHNIADCIECGACSFVCPSNIPLVQYYRASKGSMRQQAIEKQNSDRSRQRFEFRQERLAKEEAAKEAKRAARKKAAEQARQKAAENKLENNTGTDASAKPDDNPANDIVAAALARVQAKQTSPEEQQIKLERALNSAQNRLQKAQTRLSDAEPDQLERLTVKVKEAELKVQDAEKKLATLSSTKEENTSAEDNDAVATIERAKQKASMSPREKWDAKIALLEKYLAQAETELASARSENADNIAELEQKVESFKEKIVNVRNDFSDIVPSAANTPAADASDPAIAAIEKAKAKAAAQASLSPEEKLQGQIESLQKRLEKSRARLEKAEAENDTNLDAFRSAVEKLEHKLEQTLEQKLEPLSDAAPSVVNTPDADINDPDPAIAAIEKAKAKAAAQASLSPEEKLQGQIESLQKRLEKSRARLEKAEAENDANLDAFRSAVTKLEDKLKAITS